MKNLNNTQMRLLTLIITLTITASNIFATEELDQLSKFRGGEDALTYAFFILKAGPPFDEAGMLQSLKTTCIVNTTFDYAKPTKKEHARYQQIYQKEFHRTMNRIIDGISEEEMSLYANHALTDDHIRRIVGVIPAIRE